MISIVEFLISRLKKREFKFDNRITLSFVIGFILEKMVCVMRAIFTFHAFGMVGKGCTINSKSQIKIKGRGFSIGNFCYLDGLSTCGLHLGENFSLGDFSKIKVSGSLRDLGRGVWLGSNVAIGEYSYIGGAGGVTIGDDTIIGQYFSVHSENHIFTDREVLIRSQGVTRRGIKIGKNCWVGSKVTVCDGVEIGDGCVVAAGAVVVKSFPPNTILAGVPAKEIGRRDD